MKTQEINILNSFSHEGKGGNPAAVVLNSDNLTPQEMQNLAQKAGLSETAFVSSSSNAAFKLDFFTPTKQIAHCGHATVATFSYLKKMGLVKNETSSKETIDGIRKIYFDGTRAYMEQESPKFFQLTPDDKGAILEALNLKENDLLAEPEIVNTGNSFLIVHVNEQTLAVINPVLEIISEISARYNLIGFYVFAKSDDRLFDATTRMFGPYYGIEEESATGMAAGPLACYLDRYGDAPKTEYNISQGKYMKTPSPSHIHIKLDKNGDKINSLFAGGDAYVSDKITLNIDG
ncbi:PhzF family phenazine biosynthesis protein [Ekhidna sp. MALMAid0563]|uniref:PhzF family phenazine biosynthesis protein n=1 Tax=Ekhidna sp. MALMAid0563 TaxID=3143937 RepID=UPI0032E04B1D